MIKKYTSVIIILCGQFMLALMSILTIFPKNETQQNITAILVGFFVGVILIVLMLMTIEELLKNLILILTPPKEEIKKDAFSNEALHNYFKKSKEYHREHETKGIRYGQALYNVLSEIRPDLSGFIAGTTLDPFYKNEFEELQPFFTWIHNQWSKKS